MLTINDNRYTNYLKYGLNRKQGESKGGIQNAYSAAKRACRNAMQETLSKSQIQLAKKMTQSANFYLAYQRGIKNSNSLPKGFPQDGVSLIESNIDKAIDKGVKQAVMTSHGTGQVLGGSSDVTVSIKQKPALGTKGVSNDIQALQTRINAINTLCSGMQLNNPSISNLLDQMRLSFSQLQPIFKKLEKNNPKQSLWYYTKIEDIVNRSSKGMVGGLNAIQTSTEMKALVAVVNELYSALRAFGINTAAEGIFGEELILNAALVGASNAINASKTQIVGNLHNSFNAINPNIKFIGGLKGKDRIFANSNYSYSNEAGTLVGTTTQMKTDVVVTLKNSNKQLRISVKNTNLSGFSSGKISLLSGTSVLQLLHEHEEFLNHYLNIVPQRSNFTYEDHTFAPGSARTDLHNAMRAIILIGALTGGYRISEQNKVKGANILMVLDNSIGVVEYYDLNHFIQKINTNIYKINSLVPNLKTGDFDNIDAIQNQWRGLSNKSSYRSPALANTRIIGMLQDLHKMHLNVSISAKDLKNLSPLTK